MLFSEVLAQLRPETDGWSVEVGEDWQQGRTIFGGLQTALAVQALRTLVPDLPLRVVQTTFMAPVPAGRIRLQGRVLRTGKSAVHTECRLHDGDQTLCLVVAIFGAGRESTLRIEPRRPDAPGADDPQRELPFVPGITPAFTRHFQFRWCEGGFPYTGAAQAVTKIHVRFREPTKATDTQLIALADTIPSPGLSTFRKPVIASSLTWTLELLDLDTHFAADAFWRMDAEVSAAADGYLAQSVQLWNPAGRLAALSRQSVVVFG
jgi:acyl-CoA thioesterase